MKKTLISLLALAGVAAATDTTLSDAIYTSTDGASITTATTGGDAISGDFTLTMTLNADALKAIMGNTSTGTTRPTYFYVDTTKNTYITLTNALKNTGFVGMSQGNLNSYVLDGSGDPTRRPLTADNPDGAIDTNNFAASNVTGNLTSKLNTLTSAAITLSHDNTTSTSLYVTLNFSDGSTSEIYGANKDLKWSGGIGTIESININGNYVEDTYLFRGTVDKDNAFALNEAAIIPEPATATLSLLALAGLAARRRRK